MPEPQHHYLPALDPATANVPMPAVPAHWSAQPAGLLQAVGGGIAVDESAVTRGVSSIPDVWARAVLFQSALRPGHPLHTEALADWRGLLSLLALREVYGIPVEVVPVPLDGAGKLPAALRTLAPAPVALESGVAYDWTDVLLVRLDGVPVGAFSPGSLVYTATGYRERLRAHYEPQGQPAKKRPEVLDADYAFQAPTHASDKFSAHYVAEYVHDLFEAVRATLGSAAPAQRISEMLEAWLAEFRRDFGYSAGDRVNAPEVKTGALPSSGSAAHWPPLARYGVYRHALLPLVPDDGDGQDVAAKSTIFLRHRRNHTDYTGVVVVHPETLSERAKVWGLRQLASLGATPQEALDAHFDAPQGDTLAGENLGKHGAAWIRPERYFLTDVLVAPQDSTKLLAHGEQAANAGGEYLPPFKREILDFFGPDAVQSVLNPRFEDLRDGGVRFSFDLPVGKHPSLDAAGDGQTGSAPSPSIDNPFAQVASVTAQSDPTITVERVYRPKRDGDPDDGSGTLVRTDLPILELFPDYLGPSWRRYYLFQSDAGTFDCRPYAHGATLATPHDPDAYTDTHDGVPRRATVTEVHGDDPFPDGVEVRAANGTPVGLVLTPRPVWQVPGVTGTWTVGVDFGTSNTNVAWQQDNSPVQPWAVDFPHFLRPLSADPHGRRDGLLQSFFVPNRRVEFPVSTQLDLRTPRPISGRPVLDYFVNFPDAYTWHPRVRTDIKWDGDGARVTEFYLESLLLLILAETTRRGIEHVRLRCTFPKAFSDGQLTVLKGEWQRTLDVLVDANNPDALIAPVRGQSVSVSDPEHHSEGRMAGVYFSDKSAIADAKQRANPAKAVCIDVGGGTSDLALIYDGDIVYDSSIQMAGRDVAEFVAARPRLREALFSEAGQDALQDAVGDDKLFGARINEILRTEKADLPDRLNRASTNPEVVQLRQLVALKFGALAFHVGTVVGAASRRGVAPDLADRLRAGGISVHWGGNGGQLATWIDYGNYRSDGLAAQILNGLMYYAMADAELAPNGHLLLQMQSPSPKGEAARGVTVFSGVAATTSGPAPAFMVDDAPGGDGAAPTIDGVISGEVLTLTDGSSVGFLDPINLGVLFDGDQTRLAASSGERLRRFVSLFNKLGAKFDLVTANTRIPEDDATITRITEAAQGRYVEMQSRKEADRCVEPVFITEVRTLIEHVVSASN